MKHSIFCSLIMAGIAVGSANAKTITVSKTTPADFTEIQAAINSFGGVKDVDGTPNIINILDNSAYHEEFTVNVHCSIIGNSASRPRLYAKANVSNSIGTTDAALDGIVLRIPTTSATTGTTVLKNLIVLPSPTNPPKDDAIVTDAHTGFIHFDNLLVTSQDGIGIDNLGQPVSTDGLTEVPFQSNFISFGDDGIFTGTATTPVVGAGHEFLVTNCVVTHLFGTGGADGLVTSGVGARYFTIGEGNVFSYCNRLGVQGTGHTYFISPGNPTLVLGNKGFAGIWFAGFTSTFVLDADYVRLIDGVNVFNNVGSGIELNNTGSTTGGVRPSLIKRSISAGNTINLLINNTNSDGNVTIDRVTIANSKAASKPFSVAAGNNSAITIRSSIIAGNGSADVNNVIDHNGGGTLTLEGTAIVTAGPFALNSATNAGTGIVSGVASTTADPSFVQTANPKLTGFFDVASGQYSNVNATGGPLGGGAKYVGPGSSVSDWNLF